MDYNNITNYTKKDMRKNHAKNAYEKYKISVIFMINSAHNALKYPSSTVAVIDAGHNSRVHNSAVGLRFAGNGPNGLSYYYYYYYHHYYYYYYYYYYSPTVV